MAAMFKEIQPDQTKSVYISGYSQVVTSYHLSSCELRHRTKNHFFEQTLLSYSVLFLSKEQKEMTINNYHSFARNKLPLEKEQAIAKNATSLIKSLLSEHMALANMEDLKGNLSIKNNSLFYENFS
ncbi:hypothetical protein HI914_06225 [Erysiphe necator]|nr:hypothetical protein HI914_06225 [Erysiphe necator]